MARKKRHEEHEEHENHERRLITYADMITLLMVFFIVLYSMAQVDLAKYAKFKQGLDEHFGNESGQVAVEGGQGVLAGSPEPMKAGPPVADEAREALEEKEARAQAADAERESFEAAKAQIQGQLGAQGLADRVRFRVEDRGLVVTVVTDQVLFQLGSADLEPGGRVLLDGLAAALAGLPNPIAVEGHTDDHPIRGGGRYETNWELSTARATSVLRYLNQAHGLPAARLTASGYAEQRPVVPNDTEEHRAENRRVEIVVLSALDHGPTEGS